MIGVGVKLAVSAALLAWLLMRSDLADVLTSLSSVGVGTLLALAAIVAAEIVVAALKWWILLPEIRPARMLRMTLVGTFYAAVLPGQLAGEAVKAYRLGTAEASAERVAASVLVDKLLGLFGLVPLGLAGALASAGGVPDSLWMLLAFVVAAGAGGLLLVRAPWLARMPGAVRGPRWVGVVARAERFFLASARYAARPGLMAASVALGLVFHGLAIAAIVVLAPSFGIAIPLMDWLWIFAVVSLAVLLPISVGGLGVREGAFVAALGLLGVPAASALALSLTIFASQLVTAAIGGILELADAGRKRSRAHGAGAQLGRSVHELR